MRKVQQEEEEVVVVGARNLGQNVGFSGLFFTQK